MTPEQLLKFIISELPLSTIDDIINQYRPDSDFVTSLNHFLNENQSLDQKLDLKNLDQNTTDSLYNMIFRFSRRAGIPEARLYEDFLESSYYYKIKTGKTVRFKHKDLFFIFSFKLHLSYFEAVTLLNLANHHFTPWMSTRESVVAFCLNSKIYELPEVNEKLAEFGEPPIETDLIKKTQ